MDIDKAYALMAALDKNGMYQEAVKNAYEKLTKKDANGKTLMDKFGEPFDAQILEKMKF